MVISKELSTAIKASLEAGEATLEFRTDNIEVVYKEDNSPLTKADLASNKIIHSYLEKLEYPILSEETKQGSYNERKAWTKLWVVDPIDGTKEFIKGRKEFTVNIALVEENKSILGVVYAPVLETLYFAEKNCGAYMITDVTANNLDEKVDGNDCVQLPIKNSGNTLNIVMSKSHNNEDTLALVSSVEEKLGKANKISFGSSLKLCKVAEGAADFYPRLGPTMEWDTAASHAIIKEAGRKIVKYPELTELEYNKEDLLNPFFLVFNDKVGGVIDG